MLQDTMTVLRDTAGPHPAPTTAQNVRDYDQIRRAIAFLTEAWTEQPGLEELAAHLGLAPTQSWRGPGAAT